MDNYVTVGEVRAYLVDQTPEDNELEMDLSFTDEQIQTAMRMAARDYNSQPPIGVSTADPTQLPADTNLFFNGILTHLFTMKVNQWRRNDMDYSAGGVGANIVAKRIANLEKSRNEHRELFTREARDIKVTLNLRKAWGRVG